MLTTLPFSTLAKLQPPKLDICHNTYHGRRGVFSTEAWPLLGNLEDPELRRLAQSLPAMVLRSKADSTTKKHLGAFQQWKMPDKESPTWAGWAPAIGKVTIS
ncbi:hypothetical protein EMCRGX_G025544 [Ephydatia muelleri]|eukprot:Em0021g363a